MNDRIWYKPPGTEGRIAVPAEASQVVTWLAEANSAGSVACVAVALQIGRVLVAPERHPDVEWIVRRVAASLDKAWTPDEASQEGFPVLSLGEPLIVAPAKIKPHTSGYRLSVAGAVWPVLGGERSNVAFYLCAVRGQLEIRSVRAVLDGIGAWWKAAAEDQT